MSIYEHIEIYLWNLFNISYCEGPIAVPVCVVIIWVIGARQHCIVPGLQVHQTGINHATPGIDVGTCGQGTTQHNGPYGQWNTLLVYIINLKHIDISLFVLIIVTNHACQYQLNLFYTVQRYNACHSHMKIMFIELFT